MRIRDCQPSLAPMIDVQRGPDGVIVGLAFNGVVVSVTCRY